MNKSIIVRSIAIIDVKVVRSSAGIEDFNGSNLRIFIYREIFCWNMYRKTSFYKNNLNSKKNF